MQRLRSGLNASMHAQYAHIQTNAGHRCYSGFSMLCLQDYVITKEFFRGIRIRRHLVSLMEQTRVIVPPDIFGVWPDILADRVNLHLTHTQCVHFVSRAIRICVSCNVYCDLPWLKYANFPANPLRRPFKCGTQSRKMPIDIEGRYKVRRHFYSGMEAKLGVFGFSPSCVGICRNFSTSMIFCVCFVLAQLYA